MKEDYEFTILYDIYDERINADGQPEYRVSKRDCKRKWYVSDILNITDIREVPNKKGIPYKNKVEIYHRFENKWIQVVGQFSKLKEILVPNERHKIKGFR